MGGWLIVWRALRPLSQTAAYAEAIDPRHLDARLPVPGPQDELRRLTVAFNGVLDRLSASVGVQGRFMTDASHELRTPVSVARPAAQVTLAAPNRTETEYREALGIVASQTERLTRLVDDMFGPGGREPREGIPTGEGFLAIVLHDRAEPTSQSRDLRSSRSVRAGGSAGMPVALERAMAPEDSRRLP